MITIIFLNSRCLDVDIIELLLMLRTIHDFILQTKNIQDCLTFIENIKGKRERI